MLQRALASLVAVLGVAALALGVASATLWRPSDTLVAEATAAPGTTLLMTEPGVLNMAASEVTIRATGDDVVIALGRTADVEAWVGRNANTRVTGLADWNVLATTDVAARPETDEPETDEMAPDGGEGTEEPAAPPPDEGTEETDTPEAEESDTPEEGEADAEAEEPEAPPDPRGSDLWWEEATGGTSAEMEWAETDGRWSVLVASTGAGAGAPGITLTWPQEVVTPWLLPGVLVGAVLLMVGLAWWALILVAQRRQNRALVAEPETEPVAEPEPEAAAVPAAPLTRRQLREAAEAGERRLPRPPERGSIIDRFPMLVPAPRKAQSVAPAASEGAEDPADQGPEVSDEAGPGRRFSLPVVGRRGRAIKDAPEDQEGPEEREGRRSRGARGPSTAEVITDDPQPPSPSPPGAPAASAAAWRRAWGLPESDDESSSTGGDR